MHHPKPWLGLLAALWGATTLACRSAPAVDSPRPGLVSPLASPPGNGAAPPRGWRHDLPLARLFVPEDLDLPAGASGPLSVPLFLHFQGGPDVAERNFSSMGQDGVVIGSTLAGFSSAFRRPYEDPAAFGILLSEGERALSGQLGLPARFDPITISFFSAGYGAVREVLKVPEYFGRIDCLIAADSIYADVVGPNVRAPRIEQMHDFVRFAQCAARGEKAFALVHTEIVTDYASTAECADLLLASVVGERRSAGWSTQEGTVVHSEAHVGRFHLLRVAAATGESHLACLRMIPELARRYGLVSSTDL